MIKKKINIKRTISTFFKWFITDDKKNKKDMNNPQLEARATQYKNRYFGKYFTWIRPINQEKVGDTVRCTNVRVKGDMIVAEFNSGSPVSLELFEQHLAPQDDAGIVKPPSAAEVISDAPTTQPQTTNVGGNNADSVRHLMKNKKDSSIKQESNVEKNEMFKMFSKADMHLDLNLKVKMPHIDLIKMMYQQAEDKDVFLTDLSEYVLNQMNAETIKDAFSKIVIDTKEETTNIIKVEPSDITSEDEKNNV
jgi:hypothetical protein